MGITDDVMEYLHFGYYVFRLDSFICFNSLVMLCFIMLCLGLGTIAIFVLLKLELEFII